jgi:hypothetical protein
MGKGGAFIFDSKLRCHLECMYVNRKPGKRKITFIISTRALISTKKVEHQRARTIRDFNALTENGSYKYLCFVKLEWLISPYFSFGLCTVLMVYIS